MSFIDKAGEERYGEGARAGDLAESKVVEYMERVGTPVVDFGPKHVPTDQAIAWSWSPKIRHMPDFLGRGKFIEVQGCYRDSVVFKPEKLESLLEWSFEMPVWFAIYIQHSDEILLCTLDTVLWSRYQPGTEAFVLDEGTTAEKDAFRVPIGTLLTPRVHNAFTSDKKGRY